MRDARVLVGIRVVPNPVGEAIRRGLAENVFDEDLRDLHGAHRLVHRREPVGANAVGGRVVLGMGVCWAEPERLPLPHGCLIVVRGRCVPVTVDMTSKTGDDNSRREEVTHDVEGESENVGAWASNEWAQALERGYKAPGGTFTRGWWGREWWVWRWWWFKNNRQVLLPQIRGRVYDQQPSQPPKVTCPVAMIRTKLLPHSPGRALRAPFAVNSIAANYARVPTAKSCHFPAPKLHPETLISLLGAHDADAWPRSWE